MKVKKMFNWFVNLKIGVKLTSAFLVVVLFQAGIGFIALTQMSKINEGVEKIYNQSLVPGQELGEARNLVQQLRLASRDLYLYPNDVKKKTEEIEEIRKKIEAHIDAYSKSNLTTEQKVNLAHFFNKWESHNISYDQAVQLTLEGQNKEYLLTLNGGLLKFQNGMFDVLNELMESEAASADKVLADAHQAYSRTLMITIGIISFIILLSTFFGILIARIISRPLGHVAELIEKVAEGDLSETITIHTKDEIGVLALSINKMIQNFRAIIQNIFSAAENLTASSAQVSISTEEIAGASTNQAKAAQTMNELFKELSEAIRSIAQNTEEAAEIANQTILIAENGEKVVQSSIEGSGIVNSQISRLEKDSKKIGEIIEVIDDIADQTNLLALNAAIEAARAGEQGRGFAVVADEVRKLAVRSVEATHEISRIIKNMQEATILCVKSVEDGALKTQKSGEAFVKIINMINHTGSKVTEIAGASEEQAAQSSEVLSFIESISSTTEETAASSEETAFTANALTDLAMKLNDSVTAFKLNKDNIK